MYSSQRIGFEVGVRAPNLSCCSCFSFGTIDGSFLCVKGAANLCYGQGCSFGAGNGSFLLVLGAANLCCYSGCSFGTGEGSSLRRCCYAKWGYGASCRCSTSDGSFLRGEMQELAVLLWDHKACSELALVPVELFVGSFGRGFK